MQSISQSCTEPDAPIVQAGMLKTGDYRESDDAARARPDVTASHRTHYSLTDIRVCPTAVLGYCFLTPQDRTLYEVQKLTISCIR